MPRVSQTLEYVFLNNYHFMMQPYIYRPRIAFKRFTELNFSGSFGPAIIVNALKSDVCEKQGNTCLSNRNWNNLLLIATYKIAICTTREFLGFLDILLLFVGKQHV